MTKKTEENVGGETGSNETPPTPPVVPVPKSEKMTIDKKDFEKLIFTISEQQKKIDVLFDVADKGRLARATSGANGEPLIKVVKVSKWPDNSKFILGWKLTHNQSEIINGRWFEKQDTNLVFEDGTSIEVPLLDFYRKVVKEKAEVLKKTSNTDEVTGKETQIFSLRFKDGKTLEIDATYIN